MFIKKGNDVILLINLSHFEELERFLEESESLWSSRLKEYEVMANDIEEEIREEFYDYYFDEWVIYRDDFPRIAKYSVFISSFAYFEKLCSEYYYRALKKNTTLEKYHSDKLHAFDYVNWFRKNFGKKIFSKQTFHMFDEMNQVRNRIVHSNGKVVLDKNKGMVNIINNSSYLDLNDRNEIRLSKEYISEVTSVLSEIITIMCTIVSTRNE